ncbi:MAG TPA: hypothetical protein VEJ42_07630 [Streptosporangiaceae bacterium]|nr:hypothetical protein [Streptosporangiaceae bacterium]
MKSLFAALAVVTLLAVAISSGHAQTATHDPPKFSSMSQLMESDSGKIVSDLTLVQDDAKPGQTGRPGQPACYNLQNNVDPDATAIGNFVTNDVSNDVSNLQSDIDTLVSDIHNFKSDIADFVNDGVAAPAGEAQTLSSIWAKIHSEVAAANAEIGFMQRTVNAAYARANGLANGKCNGDGPGNPPQIQQVSIP